MRALGYAGLLGSQSGKALLVHHAEGVPGAGVFVTETWAAGTGGGTVRRRGRPAGARAERAPLR